MDMKQVNQRCVELMQNPDVQKHMWHPRLFWELHGLDNPKPADLTEPKVDLEELEVMLSEAAHVDSVCYDDLEARQPGKGSLIRHMLHRGDAPLLDRVTH